MNAVLNGFRRMADFRGRDTRGQFWPYALTVVTLTFIGLWLGLVPTMMAVFSDISAVAAQDPQAVTVVSGPGYYSAQINDPAVMPDMSPFFLVLGIGSLAAVILLAAAVTRRLHDTGRAGYWGLAPVLFLTFALTGSPSLLSRAMEQEQPDIGLFLLLFVNNVLYIVSLAGLVVLLALKGQSAENRYGPPPSPQSSARLS